MEDHQDLEGRKLIIEVKISREREGLRAVVGAPGEEETFRGRYGQQGQMSDTEKGI